MCDEFGEYIFHIFSDESDAFSEWLKFGFESNWFECVDLCSDVFEWSDIFFESFGGCE